MVTNTNASVLYTALKFVFGGIYSRKIVQTVVISKLVLTSTAKIAEIFVSACNVFFKIQQFATRLS